VKYHPCYDLVLTGTEISESFTSNMTSERPFIPVPGPCLVGSLTGAVAS
jgi:hypothetical protein